MIILVVALLAFATTAFATISATKHNLTTGGGFTKTTDPSATLCGFCHIPHGGSTAVAQLPLWARAIPAAPSYLMYGAGFTLSATPVGQPGTFSLTCLSCHDGTIGLGTITKNGVNKTFNMTTTLGALTANGAFQNTQIDPTNGYSPYIGTDLQNDHPVGFTFPVLGYGVNGGTPGISLLVNGSGTAGAALDTGASGASYPLFQYTGLTDRFECATCHDPHLQDTATQTKFLRSPNAGICQDCHDTK